MNEITGVKFNKNNILTYGLSTQKGLVKMRTSVDITLAYDKKGEEILSMCCGSSSDTTANKINPYYLIG